MGLFSSFFKKKDTAVKINNVDQSRYSLVRLPNQGSEALVFAENAMRSEATRGFPIGRPFKMNPVPIFAVNIDAILSQRGYGYNGIEVQAANKQVSMDFGQ